MQLNKRVLNELHGAVRHHSILVHVVALPLNVLQNLLHVGGYGFASIHSQRLQIFHDGDYVGERAHGTVRFVCLGLVTPLGTFAVDSLRFVHLAVTGEYDRVCVAVNHNRVFGVKERFLFLFGESRHSELGLVLGLASHSRQF